DRQVVAGAGSFVQYQSYGLTALADTALPINLITTDSCGNKAPLVSTITATLRTVDSNTYLTDPDSLGTLDRTAAFSNPHSSITFPVSSTGTTVFYRMQSGANFAPLKYLDLTYTPNQPPFNPVDYWNNVNNVTTGITGVSVDNGTPPPAPQLTVSFSPDQD